jgi:hypothetical protein
MQTLQNSHNKGVTHQNLHNKGFNPKLEWFCPVFVGKIFQIKELRVIKELSPGFPGLSLFWFYFIKRHKTNGQFFGWLQVIDTGLVAGFSTALGA